MESSQISIDEDARRRFEAAWTEGAPQPIERFLPAADSAQFLPTLEELVHIELELAWKRHDEAAAPLTPTPPGGEGRGGQRPRLESYLERFPQLRAKEVLSRLIQQEYRVRNIYGDQPTQQEYAQRFPEQVQAGETWVEDSRRTLAGLDKSGSRPATLPSIPGYEIIEVLGRGGMAVVYKARHKSLNRLVALKMIRGGGSEREDVIRFRTEAEAVARLQHPSIVQIFEVGEHEGEPFISLEFVSGGPLSRYLKDTPLPPRAAAELVATLARAIHYAHENGIIHRDLKPANVLLAGEGSWFSAVKVSDFGLAKRLEDTSGQTRTGAVMGTPSYMAPEQAAGRTREVGPAADIYALGAILYDAITGRPPFKGVSVLEVLEQVRTHEPLRPTKLQPKLHRDLEVICLKALSKEPRQRFATALALAEDLERFSSGEPILARPVGPLPRAWRRIRRRPLAVAAALATLCLCLVLGVLLWQFRQGAQERSVAAEKFRLVQEIEPALVECELSLPALQLVAAKLDRLHALDPEQARQKRQRFHASVTRSMQAALAKRHDDIPFQRVATVLRWFNDAAPEDARAVQQFFASRKAGWETIAQFERPLKDPDTAKHVLGAAAALFNADAQRSAPVVYTKTVSLAHGEAIGIFGRGWDQAGAIGLWLNAVIGHSGAINALAFSEDGKTLLSAGGAEVIAWDPMAGRPRWVWHAEKPGGLTVDCSSRGDMAAVGSTAAGPVIILDASGNELQRLQASSAGVASLAFSPDGAMLAIAVGDDVQFWETASWQKRASLPGQPAAVSRITYSPDGQLLATCAVDGQLKIWDVKSGAELFATAASVNQYPVQAQFTADSKKLMGTGNLDKKANMPLQLFVWERASGKATPETSAAVSVQNLAGLAVSLDGRAAFSLYSAKPEPVLLYDIGKQRQGRTVSDKAVSISESQNYLAVKFSPHAPLLAAGSSNGKVVLFDLAGNAPPKSLERRGYAFVVRPLTPSPSPPGGEGKGVRGTRGERKFRAAILRHGAVLNEQILHADQLDSASLQILAKREGNKLTLQVNDLSPIEFHDLLPWSDGGAGVFALERKDVPVEWLALSRRNAPAQPTPLEQADTLFAAGLLDEAHAAYRDLAVTAGLSDLGKEAQFKLAATLLALERREEAATALEKLAGDSGSRWAAIAACQLLLLRVQQGKLEEADAILEVLSFNHRIEELRPLVSRDLQNQLTRHYIRDFFGAEVIYKLRTFDSQHLERVIKVFDFFKAPREERFSLDVAALRAYHRSGELDKANRLVEDVLAHDYWRQEDNRFTFLRQALWVLRQQGKLEQALALADRCLVAGSEWDPHFLHLALERARVLVALGRTAEAEEDVDKYLAKIRLTMFYSYFADACLLQGFLRHQRGDSAGALESWRRGTYKKWAAEVARVQPGFSAGPLGRQHTSDVLLGMIAAALVDDFPDAETAALIADIVQRAGNEGGFALLRDRIPHTLFREMWQSPRGLDCARKLVLLDLTYDEYLRLPLVLALSEYLRLGAFTAVDAEQEAVIWSLCERLHHEYTTGKIAAPQFLALILAWKGATNFLGWGGVAPSLDPRLRAQLAYTLGFRYLRLQRPNDARQFFETAARDASADSALQKLAQAEIARLGN